MTCAPSDRNMNRHGATYLVEGPRANRSSPQLVSFAIHPVCICCRWSRGSCWVSPQPLMAPMATASEIPIIIDLDCGLALRAFLADHPLRIPVRETRDSSMSRARDSSLTALPYQTFHSMLENLTPAASYLPDPQRSSSALFLVLPYHESKRQQRDSDLVEWRPGLQQFERITDRKRPSVAINIEV